MQLRDDECISLEKFLANPEEHLRALSETPYCCLFVIKDDKVVFVIDNALYYQETLKHSQRSRASQLTHPSLSRIKNAILNGSDDPWDFGPIAEDLPFEEAIATRELMQEFVRGDALAAIGSAELGSLASSEDSGRG